MNGNKLPSTDSAMRKSKKRIRSNSSGERIPRRDLLKRIDTLGEGLKLYVNPHLKIVSRDLVNVIADLLADRVHAEFSAMSVIVRGIANRACPVCLLHREII
ncbi:hypothetical protein JTB14_022062 [Gonioctena quinquepunctata]|nr:hypothetical protein JTB14_022062 [Gonioctena quinquepunctata]